MKKVPILIALDLGTSLIKAAAYTTDGIRVFESTSPVIEERPAPGMFIQRGKMLLSSAMSCLKSIADYLGDSARNVAAIAFTGQMAGFMGVDEHFNDVTTWSCSLDTRYMGYAENQQKQFAEPFLNICGTTSPLMCAKYEWFRSEYPEEAKRIAKYVMVSHYLIGQLGELNACDATIDGSFITWTGLADVANKQWSAELCQSIGIDPKFLPRIVDSDTICGYLSSGKARILGLPSGIPLIAGAGDKVAGCVGACILNEGDMIFEAASYGGFSCMVRDLRPDNEGKRFDLICSAKRGTLYAHKYLQGSGITQDWFIDNFVTSSSKSRADGFREMELAAASVPPGSDGLFAIGLLGGSAIPLIGDLRGLFLGHTWAHKKEHFYRALLESFAYDLSLTIDRVAALYPEYTLDQIKLIGGGSRSGLFAQILADITGKTFHRLDRDDCALWGAAILAGSGIGIIKDIQETAAQHISVSDSFYPNERTHNEYSQRKDYYQELITTLTPTYQKLTKLNMQNAI